MLASVLSYPQAIIMGLIQGVTELFPVSSLGHGVLVPAWLGWHNLVSAQSEKNSFFLVFLVGLHVGTALGLLVYYRRTWARLVGGFVRQCRRVRTEGVGTLWHLERETIDPSYRLLALLVLGVIPVGVVGALLERPLRDLFAKPLAASVFLVVNGAILWWGEALRRRRGRHAHTITTAQLKPRTAFAVASTQIFALLAGISRSGVTMVGGLYAGLDHEESANFSFLLATPVILIAGLYKLPSLMGSLGDGVRVQTLVAAICAGVTAYISTRFLTRWFTTRTLTPFAIYCLVAGVISVARFI